jgi:predicted RNA binding protein YcfA (HicA-like mRNA interferase family)
MSRLPRITGREALAALKRAGFVAIRTDGSHHHLHREDMAGVVTVAVHAGKVLKPGTLRSILRQAGLTVEEFTALL